MIDRGFIQSHSKIWVRWSNPNVFYGLFFQKDMWNISRGYLKHFIQRVRLTWVKFMDTICWTLKRMNIILCAEVKQALVQMMICCRAHQSESAAAAAAAAQLTYEFVCKLNVYHIKRVSQRDAESCSTDTLLTSPPALTLPRGSDMTTFWAVQNSEHTIIS